MRNDATRSPSTTAPNSRAATVLKSTWALRYTLLIRAVRISGTNENTNGLIRQYYPKGTDFRDVSHPEARQVEKLLNNRPRACLGFRTPTEVFFEKTPPAGCD